MVARIFFLITLLFFLTGASCQSVVKKNNIVSFENVTKKITLSLYPYRKVIFENKIQLDGSVPYNMPLIEGQLFDELCALELINKEGHCAQETEIYYYGSLTYSEKFKSDLYLLYCNENNRVFEKLFLLTSIDSMLKSTVLVSSYSRNWYAIETGYLSLEKNKKIIYKLDMKSLDNIYSKEAEKEMRGNRTLKDVEDDKVFYSKFIFDDLGYLKFVE
jgi:hypothetical protein